LEELSFAGSYRTVFADPTACQIVSMNAMAGNITTPNVRSSCRAKQETRL